MKKITGFFGMVLCLAIFCTSNILAMDFLKDKIKQFRTSEENNEAGYKMVCAARDGDIEELRRLLDGKQADVNYSLGGYPNNGTALHSVLIRGKKKRVEVVKFLIAKGINVNAIDENKQTPLMVLIMSRVIKDKAEGKAIIDELVKARAKIDAQDKDGNTALHLAAQFGPTEFGIYLLEAGARVNIANNDRCLPYDLTIACGFADLLYDYYRHRTNCITRTYQRIRHCFR